MKRLLSGFLALLLLLITPSFVYAQSVKEPGTNLQLPLHNSEIIIKLKSGKKIEDIFKQKNLPFIRSQFDYFSNKFASTQNTKQKLSQFVIYRHANSVISDVMTVLKNNEAVEYVEPNYVFQMAAVPNDPKFYQQYYLQKIQAPAAWDKTTGSHTVIVAVIDSGIDSTHPDIAQNIWHDSNGHAGYNFGDNNYDTSDSIGHGTHIAGVIGAVGNNNLGISGTNWSVQIMPVKVVGKNSLTPSSTVAEAIMYATDHGANVINMSFGAPYIHSQVVTDAIEYAWSKNVILVASAGNKVVGICPIWFPANLPHVVAAGGTDQNDNHPDYSCTGNELDITAPASNIISIDRGGGYTNGVSNTGTSYSAAVTSGSFALLLSTNPNMNNQEAVNRLEATADDLGTPGYDPLFGFGRINLARAVSSVPTTPTPVPSILPTPTPVYFTPTPTQSYGTLSIRTNVAPGVFVPIGTPVTICYTVPHPGRVVLITQSRNGNTYNAYNDTGSGNCVTQIMSEPTGGRIFKVIMDTQTATTSLTVIPDCPDCVVKPQH
jgi:subtilisin family serine protease